MSEALPEPDRIGTAPHPRHTMHLYGQKEAEAAFLDAYVSGRQHHAWLLKGPRGIGKATFAWRATRFLLTNKTAIPQSLEAIPDHPVLARLAALSEPNLFLLRRPWDERNKRFKTDITVDEVRKLNRFFGLSSADKNHRVVIVDAADELNIAAANAFLKLLEEPPANTTLFLISHQPAKLLPTIRSRCRSLSFTSLSETDLASVIEACGLGGNLQSSIPALAQGSAGMVVELMEADGAKLYADLIDLWEGGRFNRATAIRLADTMAGIAGRPRFALLLTLLDHFFTRVSKAGLIGPPYPEASLGESALLARLSPTDHAARKWANLAVVELARLRHGQAVNLDPSAMVLDTLNAIEAAAQKD